MQSMVLFGNFRDHASGNEKLVSLVPGLTVCGNDERIGALNKTVKHNNQFKVHVLLCIVCSFNYPFLDNVLWLV